MLRVSQQFTVMTVHHQWQVGAGNVVPFTARPKTQTIIVPREYADRDVEPVEVCGDSFIEENLYTGDILLALRRFERAEITPGRLCVVRVGGVPDLALKRVFIEKKRIRLACANSKYEDLFYDFEMVEVWGIVVARYTYEPIR